MEDIFHPLETPTLALYRILYPWNVTRTVYSPKQRFNFELLDRAKELGTRKTYKAYRKFYLRNDIAPLFLSISLVHLFSLLSESISCYYMR